MGINDDVTSLWDEFSKNGQFSSAPEGTYVSGAISGTVILRPGETKEVTVVMGWYFPDRDFFGIPVGELDWYVERITVNFLGYSVSYLYKKVPYNHTKCQISQH